MRYESGGSRKYLGIEALAGVEALSGVEALESTLE